MDLQFLGFLVLAIAFVLIVRRGRVARRLESRQAERARRDAEKALVRRNQDESQQKLRVELKRYGNEALAAYSRIPAKLLTAEESLDRAEQEFAEVAFSPFWEAIEATLHKLAEVEGGIERLAQLADSHADTASYCDASPEAFPIDVKAVSRLDAIGRTEQRMRSVVRAAQKDFQFATIFEQRRTTHVLIDGFRNLGHALDGLGDRLASSIDSLSEQVRHLESGLQERHADMASSIDELANGVRRASAATAVQHDAISAAHLEAANKQLAMLDNIQRGRKPLL
jgi:hypothetical protein